MDRRKFLAFMGAGVAGLALDQAIPLGRVWSFPKKIVIPNGNLFLDGIHFEWDCYERLSKMEMEPVYPPTWKVGHPPTWKVGDTIHLPKPTPWLFLTTESHPRS